MLAAIIAKPFIGKALEYVRAVPLWVWLVIAAVAYNFLIENPRIVREARRDYVDAATRAALQAEVDEALRQRDAAQRTADAWRVQLERYQADAAKREEEVEKDIAAFEAAIAAGGKSCKLDQSDIDFLRR